MPTLHELLDLPAFVPKSDFVQSLALGISSVDKTVNSYAVTPALYQAFRHALSILRSALQTGRSLAAFLHGSFGSGKSHFLAMLDLLLADNPTAWRREEFHALRQDHPWLGQKKLLQIPMVLTGAESLESHIFGTYVQWSKEHHPDAPIPALFQDQELFANAQVMRRQIGDTAFFGALNRSAGGDGWGEMAGGAWTETRFEETMASADPKDRGTLFSALVATLFPAFAKARHAWLGFDQGLEVLSQHAASLGYAAVVFYLDELFLWLGGQSSNLPFIQAEVQKLAKLKEAQYERRTIPIVSFISRQRDLSQFLGEQARGVDLVTLEDSLNFNSGRFEVISLADSNLPAIVEKRVLRPRNEEAKQFISGAFERAWRASAQARATLYGGEGTEEAFRRLYPFSPALVEALVALSNCLQRERTAIRLLMELLVEHVPDLDISKGQIIPVGDIFDAIAGGEDAFDQGMKQRFDRAKAVYQDQMLPLIQQTHSTTSPERCQRMRPEHPVRLGCSKCPITHCRNDNRMAKTLLLAALVPAAMPFKDLTARKLVNLNHGVMTTLIPGDEVRRVAEKVRHWASQIGAVRVGEGADPKVSIHLDGVDLQPILSRAEEHNNEGSRKSMLRTILFEALGLGSENNVADHVVDFYHTRRKGLVRYGNVRELPESTFKVPEGKEWQVIIDYPFDAGPYSPEDDQRRVAAVREAQRESDNGTVVWLPTFFSSQLNQELGVLVVLEEILRSPTSYLNHLRPEDVSRARQDLESLRNQKRQLVRLALSRAYGLVTVEAGDTTLDSSRRPDEHFISLLTNHVIRGLIAVEMKEALTKLVTSVLEQRYPHHPPFGDSPTTAKLDRIRQAAERLLEAPNYRLPISAAERKDLENLGAPLKILEVSESAAILLDDTFRRFEKQRAERGHERPTVADVRVYIDPNGTRGLPAEASDLLVWVYALRFGYTLQRDQRPYEMAKLGSLPDDVELIRPELPGEVEWQAAIGMAGHLFGYTQTGKFLSARNLATFVAKVQDLARDARDAVALPAALELRLGDWAEGPSARLDTARWVAALIARLRELKGVALIRELATATPQTSATAAGRSFATADKVISALQAQERWLNYESVRRLSTDTIKGAKALGILEDLQKALVADELIVPLVPKMEELTRRAADLLKATKATPTEGSWRQIGRKDVTISGVDDIRARLNTLADELETELRAKAGSGEVRVSIGAMTEYKERK